MPRSSSRSSTVGNLSELIRDRYRIINDPKNEVNCVLKIVEAWTFFAAAYKSFLPIALPMPLLPRKVTPLQPDHFFHRCSD